MPDRHGAIYQPQPPNAGFSLLQWISTLAVGAILLTIAIPQWGHLADNNAILTAQSDMLAMLQMGRLKAVIERQRTTLCPTDDHIHCNGEYQAWHKGYMLFIDLDGDKARDPNESLIRVNSPIAPHIRLQSSKGRRLIRYQTDGSAWGSNVTLRFCSDPRPSLNRAIILYGGGRARLSKTLSNGKPVTCD